MEVGVGQLDVTQRWYLEVEAVGIGTGDSHAAFGFVGGLVGLDNTHALEGVASHCRAVVASHTAAVTEQRVAFQLCFGHSLGIALEPFVKA